VVLVTDVIGASLTERTHTRNDSTPATTSSAVSADVAVQTEHLSLPALPVRRRPGRLTVEFIGDFGKQAQHLDMVPAGTLVTATGSVTALQVLGTDEAPRAVFTVTGVLGEAARGVVDTEHYLDLWDCLVAGSPVQVSGKVRRPLHDEPAYIEVLAIQVVGADAQVEAVSA
jgi:hypothetical protein